MSLADGLAASVSLAIIEQPHTEQSTTKCSAKGSSAAALDLQSAADRAPGLPGLSNFECLATKAVLGGIRMTDTERTYLEGLMPNAIPASSSGKVSITGTREHASTAPSLNRNQVRGDDFKTEQALEGAVWDDFEQFVQHIFGSNQVPRDSKEERKYINLYR